MLLRKYMSLLGIGSAKIDLILDKEIYEPGECVNGYFLIKGGTIEQQLNRIDCDLVMIDLDKKSEEIIDSISILMTDSIESEVTNKIPFSFHLPEFVRVSSGELSYRFKTKMSFMQGVESFDQDAIQITEKRQIS